eukprot:scpid34722/ scgid32215/ 
MVCDYFSISPDCDSTLFSTSVFTMPKSVFDQGMEKEIMRLYVEVFAGSSGKTLTTVEKQTMIADKLNDMGKLVGWPTVTASNVEHKIDSVRRTGKKMYRTFRLKTRTGAPVESDFDLKVIMNDYVSYIYHNYLFHPPTCTCVLLTMYSCISQGLLTCMSVWVCIHSYAYCK